MEEHNGKTELRRQAKSRKKEQEKISKVLKNAGFPEFQLPPAPLKTVFPAGEWLTLPVLKLPSWNSGEEKGEPEGIRKACIMEAQGKIGSG